MYKKVIAVGCVWMLICGVVLINNRNILQAAGEKKEEGLVAYWPMDEATGEITKDISGNHNDGKLSNADWVEGISGSALSINGPGSCVTCGKNAILNMTDELTIEAWVNPVYYDRISTIVSKHPCWNHASGYAFGLNYAGTGKKLCYDGHKKCVGSRSNVKEGEWSHVAVVRNKDTVTFYINGKVDSEAKGFPAKITENEEVFRIGSDIFIHHCFKGRIDEVRVYNRALTSEEIKEHYFVNMVVDI